MEVILDLEADSLKPKIIHCIVVKELTTGKVKSFVQEQCYTEFPQYANQVTKFIGHNIISFDVPVINRLLNMNIPLEALEDTMILSQLMNPVRDGGHSLEAWGVKLGFPKMEHNDFTRFTSEMLAYCKQDVELTNRVWLTLSREVAKLSSQHCVQLEYKVRQLVNEQQETGFKLDIPKAMMLSARLRDKARAVERQVHETFLPLAVSVRDVVPKYTKDGKLSRVGLSHLDGNLDIVAGPHTAIEWPEFNLNSRQQIVRHLMLRGWKPEKFTEKGNPIVDEEVLEHVTLPEAQLIKEYLLLGKRVTQIDSWLELVQEDGKVHGNVLTIGAISTRMAHSTPNMAQVPASYSPYGKECRECWTISDPKHVLLGCDASSLELRGLAHYLGDPKFTAEVVDGDIHTANQKAAGLETRAQAKTFIYAFIYGAGPAKIGLIVGGNAKDGQRLIDQFLANVPAINSLRKRVDMASKRGYLIGLDGRKLMVRSAHAAVNLLIQGAGAVICKQWLVEIDKLKHQNNIRAKLVASVHDEYQFEVHKDDAEKFGLLTKQAMKEAEKVLKVKCQLDSEFRIGNTWAETH